MVTLPILVVLGSLTPGDSEMFPTYATDRTPEDVVELSAPARSGVTCVLGVDFVRAADGSEVSPIVIDDRVLAFVFTPAPGAAYTAMPFSPHALDGRYEAPSEVRWLAAEPLAPDPSVRVEAARTAPAPPTSSYVPPLPARVRLFEPPADPVRITVTSRGGIVRVLHLRARDDHHWRIAEVDVATPDTPYGSRTCRDGRDAFLVVDLEEGSSYRIRAEAARGEDRPHWTVLGDDDGETDSHWGQVGAPSQRAVKTFTLDTPPGRARIAYRMATAPYHPIRRAHAGDPKCADAEWGVLEVFVNGQRTARHMLPDIALAGWHLIPVDAAAFRAGENEVALSVSGSGAFYLSIDHDRDAGRSYSTTGGRRSASLRPGKSTDPGEYLLRLWVSP